MSNTYTRTIRGTHLDVYDVMRAYEVTDPAIAHAVKKLLVPGGRSGGKSRLQDLLEAYISIENAIDWEAENNADDS